MCLVMTQSWVVFGRARACRRSGVFMALENSGAEGNRFVRCVTIVPTCLVVPVSR
jgi:hypothetical protein